LANCDIFVYRLDDRSGNNMIELPSFCRCRVRHLHRGKRNLHCTRKKILIFRRPHRCRSK